MSIYLTQIQKHRFVCGLFWQSLSHPRELKREAEALARKIDCDLMILRKENATAQAGFAQSREGAKRMMFSLAAVVSRTVAVEGAYYDGQRQRVHNWLGAFKLPDGMWVYFAVRDSNFLPNGDFAGTKQEVLDRLNNDYGLGGWNVVIGDAELEEYGFHNFNAKRIEELLPHTSSGKLKPKNAWGLSRVGHKIKWQPLAGIGILALLMIGAAGYWLKYQRIKEARNQAIAAQSGVADGALSHPWASKPAPQPMVRACLDQFTHITAGGWLLNDYVCTPEQATYSWSRNNAVIELLLKQVPNAVISIDGNNATYTEKLAPSPGNDEALLASSQLLQPLLSRLQLLKLATIIKEVPPLAPQSMPGSVGAETKAPPPPNWKKYSFSLATGGIPPMEVATILSQPGIRIEKFFYRGHVWSIEGAIYAK